MNHQQALTDQLHATARLEPTRELRKLGWKVTLLAPGQPEGKQLIRGVEAYCIPMPRSYLLGQVVYHLKVLRTLMREWTTLDVILFHQMSAPWLLPLKVVRGLTRRQRPLLVMDSRTVPMVVMTSKDRLRARFSNLGNWMANRWADGQTAITPHMAEAVRIPPGQLWGIWPSGVNLELFAPSQTARRWPPPGKPIHLVYTGVLDHVRNLMPLCRATERANAEGMAFTLSLVGKGGGRSDLEKYAHQTEGRVRVRPPVPHDRVPEVLAEAHVGVLPFPDEERLRVSSFIKLFEYMAAGLPILATRIVALTDVMDGKGCAFWAEDASVEGLLVALRLVWRSCSSLEEMGCEAASDAQAWTWEAASRKLRDALEHGLAGASSGGRLEE
jgi:glycosyltransferase involved in cell wall biosynthesis